jgi:hypothetical protein
VQLEGEAYVEVEKGFLPCVTRFALFVQLHCVVL